MPTIDMATRARGALQRTVALLIIALLATVVLSPTQAGAAELGRKHRSRVARIDARTPGRHMPLPRRVLKSWELTRSHHDYPAWDGDVKIGTPIFAIRAGKVFMVLRSGACGNGVMIRAIDNFTYLYCHGKKILVNEGERVKAGERIMRSGMTGSASNPHLHLQLTSPSGQKRCPQRLLRAEWRGRRIPTNKAPAGGCSY